MRALRRLVSAATMGLACMTLSAASPPSRLVAQTAPGARPGDVETIDAIIGALYETISGPAGEVRDWDRFRSLFVEGARLIPTSSRSDGTTAHRITTVDEYIQSSGALLEERGFFEGEIHRTVEHYGPVIHAFSTYESRWTAEDPDPFDRGINSIQLLHDGTRWWLVGVFWHGESSGTPVPAKYLPGNRR